MQCSLISTKKISECLTHWLKHDEMPTQFEIEKTAVFKDPKQAGRVIRCQ